MAFRLTFVLSSSSSFPSVWPILGACAGVYLFYHGFQLLVRKRLIENTPSSKIRSAAMGLVELSGLATGPYTMNAPITGLPCYYYRTMVWQWKRQGKSSSWVKAADESLHLPFFLDDGTARVLVDPQGAELDIHRDFHDEFSESVFSSSLEVPANISNFLMAHGVSTDKRIKVEEYCIKPKNSLFILGTLAENPGISVSATPARSLPLTHSVSFNLGSMSLGSSLSITETTTIRLFKGGAEGFGQTFQGANPAHLDPAQQAKIAEVLTKAGITNPAAWAVAGVERGTPAAPVAVTSSTSGAAAATAPEQFDLHPHTVLMKGAHSPAFFISWRSQRDVVHSLGWKSALMIWGGPALTLLCVYILAAGSGWL
ncbi:MAG: hypothetical protein LAO09_05640 [Acidobacteriia bacterium]|nr:hypothetical protein [Terriglobia bacterium]